MVSSIGVLDIIVFVLFLCMVVGVGMIKSRRIDGGSGESTADYFLAGRGLTWWLIGFSLIAANISAEQFVGMSGQAADYLGLAIASYEWMAAVVLVVVAFFFLPYFLRTGIFTIPQFLEYRYNSLCRTLMAAMMMFILVCVSLVAVIYAGAIPMCELFRVYGVNVSLTTCCWAMGIMAAIYVAFGGLKACAWADLIQGSALILCGIIVTYLAFKALGLAPVESLTMSDGSSVAAGTFADNASSFSKFLALNKSKLHMALPASDKILPYTALIVGLWIPNFYYWGLNQFIMQRVLGSASLREGQKGVIFAAFLKLLIPFIVVFPGIISFNLYKDSMVESASKAPAIQESNKKILASFEAAKASPAPEGFVVYTYDSYWGSASDTAENQQAKVAIDEYNTKVKADAAAKNVEVTEHGKKLVGIYTDSAFSTLLSKLVSPGNGLLGFLLAALLGAIVSSIAAILNAASTIFTMDIYDKYIQKNASQKTLVKVGRICIGVFVVIGCFVAPFIANPKFGGVFTFIQEFQGYVTPGILAIFVYGLLNRRGAGITGVIGLLLNPIMYFLLAQLTEIAFLDRMAVCFVTDLVVMFVVGMVKRLPAPVEFKSNTNLDLTPSRGAQFAGGLVIVLTAIFYIFFW